MSVEMFQPREEMWYLCSVFLAVGNKDSVFLGTNVASLIGRATREGPANHNMSTRLWEDYLITSTLTSRKEASLFNRFCYAI